MVTRERPSDFGVMVIEEPNPEKRAKLILEIAPNTAAWNAMLNYVLAHLRAQEIQQMLPYIPEENRDLIFKLANKID